MATRLFESDGVAITQVRLEIPLSFDEMVAALYYGLNITSDDLRQDSDVREEVMIEVGVAGLTNLALNVRRLEEEEAANTVENPEWLALCRRRISEVFGSRQQHALAGVA